MPRGGIVQTLPPGQYYFALGTVGWGTDPNYYQQVAGEKTLVKITLVWGRNPTVPLNHATAQGMQILAAVGGPLYQIPPLGALVSLGIPDKMARMPGAAIITGWHMPAPEGFDATNAMWSIADGQWAIIGDKNAVEAALGTIAKQWFDEIKSKFDNHTHSYLPGAPPGPPTLSSPPTSTPAPPFLPLTSITDKGDPRAKKVKIT